MLQQRGVISIAFGQSHYLALFRNGSISSFGREEEGCGALGIGGHRDIKRLRGYECESICQSAFPLEDSHFSGCQVWFEKEKLQWLKHLSSGGCDPKEAEERFQLYQQDTSVQADVSDWVEYLGINWAARVGAQATDEFGLSSYFGFRISAGSRHSAALIIVNENLASHIRDAYLVKREPQQGPQQVQQISPRTSHSPFSLKQSASRLFDALTRPSRSMSFSRLLNTPTSKLEIKCTSSSTQAVVPSRGVRRPPERSELENSSETQDKKYQWMYEEFPRLRLDDGREMPGDIPFHNQA